MDFANMTTDELLSELDKADAERMAAKERGREIKTALVARQNAEHAIYYGFTAEEYAQIKEKAAAVRKAETDLENTLIRLKSLETLGSRPGYPEAGLKRIEAERAKLTESVPQLEEAVKKAAKENVPFANILGKARKAKAAQIAKVGAASVGAKAKRS